MARLESAERKVLQFTDTLLSEGRQAKERLGLPAQWSEFRKVREGMAGQWRGSRAPHFFANLLSNYLDRKIAALTECKPDIMVTSRRKDYSAPAKILNDTCQAAWDHLTMQEKLETGADNAAVCGVVGFAPEWDPDANYGRGDISIKVFPPEAITLDPAVCATEDLPMAEYVIWEEILPLSVIQEKFGVRGMLVTPDAGYTLYPQAETTGRRRVAGPTRPLERDAMGKGIGRAKVQTFWVRDLTKTKTGEYEYPGGRRILRAGDVVLHDGPNPYWDGQCPLELWNWYKRSGSVWGDGDVTLLRKLGEAFNRMGDLLIRNAILNNNIWIIGDFDALEAKEWNKLDNLEALVIKKRFTRDIRREPPPNMPPYYFQLLSFIPQVMETMIGLLDIAPGGRRTPSQSLGALEGYQQAAMGLVRKTNRSLETTVRRIGQKLISRIVQYYTSDRVFSIVGPSESFTQYVFERARLLTDNKGNQIFVTKPGEHQQFLAEFNYLVRPESGLVMARIQRALLFQQLAQAGLITGKAVLRALGSDLVPDWEAEHERATHEMAEKARMGVLPGNRRVRSNRQGSSVGLGA